MDSYKDRLSETQRAENTTYVYQVEHEGPCGTAVIGTFSTLEKATKAKAEWDAEHSHPWDKAEIRKREVK